MSERLRVGRLVLAALVLASVACGPKTETASAPAAAPPGTYEILTVGTLQRMVQQGETVGILLGKIESSGTVYDLTTKQKSDLRADGMPASLIAEIELTRLYAVEQEPSLGTSRERWKEIDGFWYGGLPLGWPVEWVRGGPKPGASFR